MRREQKRRVVGHRHPRARPPNGLRAPGSFSPSPGWKKRVVVKPPGSNPNRDASSIASPAGLHYGPTSVSDFGKGPSGGQSTSDDFAGNHMLLEACARRGKRLVEPFPLFPGRPRKRKKMQTGRGNSPCNPSWLILAMVATSARSASHFGGTLPSLQRKHCEVRIGAQPTRAQARACPWKSRHTRGLNGGENRRPFLIPEKVCSRTDLIPNGVIPEERGGTVFVLWMCGQQTGGPLF